MHEQYRHTYPKNKIIIWSSVIQIYTNKNISNKQNFCPAFPCPPQKEYFILEISVPLLIISLFMMTSGSPNGPGHWNTAKGLSCPLSPTLRQSFPTLIIHELIQYNRINEPGSLRQDAAPGPILPSTEGQQAAPWHTPTLHTVPLGAPAHLPGSSAHAGCISLEPDNIFRHNFLSQYHWQMAGEQYKDRFSHHQQ